MTTLYRTLLVATLALAAYLTIALENGLANVGQQLAENQQSLALVQEQLGKQQELTAALQAELAEFHKQTNERIAKEEKRQAAVQSVQSAWAAIAEAEALRKAGDLYKAHTLLSTVKEPLWKAGDFFSAEQAGFRSLMNLIDAVLTAWKNGNGAVDVSKITSTLKPLMEKISHDN